jgi:hypothetical protein
VGLCACVLVGFDRLLFVCINSEQATELAAESLLVDYKIQSNLY